MHPLEQLRQNRLRLLPLQGKVPIQKDWQHRASPDVPISGNYGILCDRITVIDTDSPALAQWWAENMPETPWRVRTPRGGEHFVYAATNLGNAQKAGKGWDIRSGGK